MNAKKLFLEGARSWMLSRAGICSFVLIAVLAASNAVASFPVSVGVSLTGLAYVDSSPDTVFGINLNNGIFISTDRGSSWRALNAGRGFSKILMDPHDPNRILALREFGSSQNTQYLESVDGGRTWNERRVKYGLQPGRFEGFAVHPSRPGLWIALLGGETWASRNNGASWEVAPNPAGSIMQSALSANGEAFYIATDKNEVWRSEDGFEWHPTNFPAGHRPLRIASLAGDRVLVKSERYWWLREKSGPWEQVSMLSPYETRGKFLDHCHPPLQSPADPAYLFATCTNRNKYPGGVSTSQDFSTQLHSMDGGLTWSAAGGSGMADSWNPSAIALHPRDSSVALVAWVEGQVYRTMDRGASWQYSDRGLRLLQPGNDLPAEYRLFDFPRERRLNQAVMAHDIEIVKQIAVEGARMDERGGDKGLTAIDWALQLGGKVEARGDRMYWELRALGAPVPPQTHPASVSTMESMARGNFGSVLEDMVRSGWRLTMGVGEAASPSVLKRWSSRHCTSGKVREATLPCPPSLLGRPLAFWVELHLSIVSPGESAQMIVDLAQLGELSLASRVALFDSGSYGDPKVIRHLLLSLPADASALRRKIAADYKGRFGDISARGDIYGALIGDPGPGNWVLDVLPVDRSALEPGNAAILVRALLGSVGRPDWVRALVLGHAGPRIDAKGWQEVSDFLVLSCDPQLVASALKAGVRFAASVASVDQSSVRVALRKCADDRPARFDAYLGQLHHAGLRLRSYEWWDLGAAEVAALLRFPGHSAYRGVTSPAADVGMMIVQEQQGEGFPRVEYVIEGSPAQMAAIRPGARLVSIDGVLTRGMALNQALLRLRGAVGSPVALTVIGEDGRRSTHRLFRQTLPNKPSMAVSEK